MASRLLEVVCHPVITNLRRAGYHFEKCKTRQFVKYALLTMMLIQLPIFMIANMKRGSLQRSTSAVTSTEIANDIFQRREREIKKEGLGERKILVNSRNDYTASDRDDFILNYAKDPDEGLNQVSKHGRGVMENPVVPHSLVSTESESTASKPKQRHATGSMANSSKPLCPRRPPNLLGRLEFNFNSTPPTLQQVAEANKVLSNGGSYEPPDCIARSRVAIIVPHRARELHLRALLWHIHPIFQRQQLQYKVYVVHQAGELAFNKAKLMNIGFLEAIKDADYDCVVFHDVDLLPEDDRLLYHCGETPTHFSVAIDKYGYRLPYASLFGGVTMVSLNQFKDVNGYSNMYWGWGGEDDDMFNRVFSRGYTIHRPPFHLARYKMTFHHRDKGNSMNLMRYEILSGSVNRIQEDGLNNVKYNIVDVSANPIYTNITADVGTAIVQCKSYLSDWTCSFVLWMCEYLVMSCGMLQYNSTDDGTLSMTSLTAL